MATIDSRVVEMNFDGGKFGTGVEKSLGMLDRLKSALHLNGASRGLQEVNAAAQRFDSSAMQNGAGAIASSFSSMQAVAFGALASVGAKAMAVGSQIANSFTLEPVMAGFKEYETNIGSIQTILSNTKSAGTNLQDVEVALENLNKYSDETIYNFADMANAIGRFTAAGVELQPATNAIKGIANLAALSGSNSEQASRAMQQLGQAISSGTVSLEDWNSVESAGMGGTIFQRALAQTAVAMGDLSANAVKLDGPMQNVKVNGEAFRKSISAVGGRGSWLTSEVLTNTLAQFTGDLTDAELAAQGFNGAQIEAIKSQAVAARAAAQDVRTLSGMMDTLKEGVTSGWAQSFSIIVGNFDEAKELFTGLSNAIGGMFQRQSVARIEMLTEWKKLGGRTALIEGLTDLFWAFAAPVAQVGQAFREIFPKMTASRLSEITYTFRDLMAELRPSPETLDRIQRTFAGIFAVLGIGWEVIKAVAMFFGRLFMGLTEGDQGILRITASIGDFLVGLHQTIKAGGGIAAFFDKLLGVIFKIINPIRDAGQALGKMFEGVQLGGLGESIGNFITGLLTLGDGAEKAGGGVSKLKDAWDGFLSFFANMGRSIANFMQPVTDAIMGMFQNIDYDQLMEGLQTGALAAIALFIKQLGGMFSGFSIFQNDMGFVDRIKEGLDGITGTLSAMQANLKASMILKIAAAVALLAISVVLLAGVDAVGLARATGALTVMFIQLGVAMAVFQKIGTIASIAKLNLMGSALILLGIAILILAGAVKVLATMSWEELGKGLGALIVLIGGLIALSHGLDRSRGAIIRSSFALIIMAGALKLLVGVVRDLGAMDLMTLGKGLGSFAILLAGLALFSKIQAASATSLAQAAGILLLAFAVKTLAEAVKIFATMSWEELARGFAGLAGGLIAVGLALQFMPNGTKLLFAALGIGKVAAATMLIAKAMQMYADIDWNTIAKGLTSLGGSLAILVVAMKYMPKVGLPQALGLLIVASAIATLAAAVRMLGEMDILQAVQGVVAVAALLGILVGALNLMNGTLAGAAAILIVAAALNVLVPVITTLGNTPIPVLAIGLGALAAVFVLLGLAGLILAPVVPVLIALGIAIALIGAAVALAGVGVFLFATGLTALGLAGAAATAGIVAIVSGLIGLIPMVIEQIGLGIVAFANVIATSGPAILAAITAVLTALLQAIIDVSPKVGEAFLVLLFNLLNVINQALPRLIQAGFNILLAFLDGIARNIGRVVNSATNIIVNFLDGIARNLPRIIDSGIKLIIAFVNGLADGIRNNSKEMGEAGGNLATAIVEGMIKGIGAGAKKVVDAAKNLAKDAWNAAKDFLGISSPSKKFIELGRYSSEGLAKGLDDYSYLAAKASEGIGSDIVNTLGKTISGLGDMINGDVDMNPVITPVLDLSDVRRDAAGLGTLLEARPLNVGGSYSGAASASAGYRSNLAAVESEASAADGEGIMFVQNNYSPKAISPAETYRNTRSQLSIAKEALKTNAD